MNKWIFAWCTIIYTQLHRIMGYLCFGKGEGEGEGGGGPGTQPQSIPSFWFGEMATRRCCYLCFIGCLFTESFMKGIDLVLDETGWCTGLVL